MQRDQHQKFTEAWGSMAAVWGVSRSVSQTYAMILLRNESMCADEIKKATALSSGNISMVLNTLLDYELIYQDKKPGERKQYFRAERDLWVVAEKLAKYQMRRSFAQMSAVLAELGPEMGSRASSVHLTDVKEEILDITNALTSFMAIFPSLKPKSILTKESKKSSGGRQFEYSGIQYK